MQEQLDTLAKLQANRNVNVLPIATQENASKVNAQMAIAGLGLIWAVDPEGALNSTYDVQNLPTHYFVDRKGTVKKVSVGVLSEQQIITALGGL